MPSELDQQYTAVLGQLTAPDGMLALDNDPLGNPVPKNFPATLPGMFRFFAANYADREALVSGDERLSFAELDALSDKVARGLVARGIRKGDRVGIAMRNCSSWVLAYMGALKAGGIATLINGWWREAELAHALSLTDPALVIADAPRARLIGNANPDCQVLTLDIDKPVAEAMRDLIEGSDDEALPEVAPEDDATILFTSGSTGDAKGAVSTHRAVTAATYTYVASLMVLKGILTVRQTPPPEQRRTLAAVPLFHVTGEVPVMLTTYVVGGALIIMGKWDAGDALKLIEREAVTAFTGVPTMALELMNHPDRDKYDVSALGDIQSGGAPRPASHVARQAQEMPKIRSVQGYGLTETNAVGAGNFWENYTAKSSSTGKAQPPFVDIAIFGDDDQKLGTGEVGEIGIKAAANIRGYWRAEDATRALFTHDHYVRTGDLGYLDDEGYLFIVDRKKEIVIRGGENISTAEVEAAIYAHPDVAECSVFGAPDERLGEVPVGVIHAREAGCLSDADLQVFLAGRLAKFKIPERFIFVDEDLPKLGTGKIDRRALKAQYVS